MNFKMSLGLPDWCHLVSQVEKYVSSEYKKSWSYEMLAGPISTSETVISKLTKWPDK